MNKKSFIIVLIAILATVTLLSPFFIVPIVDNFLNTPNFESGKVTSKDAALYINGQLIDCDNVKVYHYTRDKILRVKICEALGIKLSEIKSDTNSDQIYEQIPLTAVLKALGAEITWVDDYHANIVLDSIDYKLDIEKEPCLYRTFTGTEHNLLDYLCGANRYGDYSMTLIETADREVLICSNYLNSALIEMNKHLTVETSYEKAVVNITFHGTVIDFDYDTYEFIYAE